MMMPRLLTALAFFGLLGGMADAQITVHNDSVAFDEAHGRLRHVGFEDVRSVTVQRMLFRNPWLPPAQFLLHSPLQWTRHAPVAAFRECNRQTISCGGIMRYDWNEELRRAYDQGYWDARREFERHLAQHNEVGGSAGEASEGYRGSSHRDFDEPIRYRGQGSAMQEYWSGDDRSPARQEGYGRSSGSQGYGGQGYERQGYGSSGFGESQRNRSQFGGARSGNTGYGGSGSGSGEYGGSQQGGSQFGSDASPSGMGYRQGGRDYRAGYRDYPPGDRRAHFENDRGRSSGSDRGGLFDDDRRRSSDDDRGLFDRAGDKIRSWFDDDDRDRGERRDRDRGDRWW